MRGGYTLSELVLALAVAGILAGTALPRTLRMRDALTVEQAARQIAVAHQRARIAAILQNGTMVLTISADSITLRPRHATAPLWRETGPAANGVTLTTAPRQITFSPVGLAVGAANATYTLTRGDARRSVVVSRLGRVRIVP